MRFGTFISFGPPGCSSANLKQDGNVRKSVSFEGCRGNTKLGRQSGIISSNNKNGWQNNSTRPKFLYHG
jgi:hypothetical protein